jgi:hypothetical protein
LIGLNIAPNDVSIALEDFFRGQLGRTIM